MTWTKLPDTFGDDPALLQLPRGVRLLYVEALVWCNKQETDGRLPQHVLRRITDEADPVEAMTQLVSAGLAEPVGGAWQLVRFADEQITREELAARRRVDAERQARFRRHRRGEHGAHCPSSCHTVTHVVSNGMSHAAPTRPDPTRRVGVGEGDERTSRNGVTNAVTADGRVVALRCPHGAPYAADGSAACGHDCQRPAVASGGAG